MVTIRLMVTAQNICFLPAGDLDTASSRLRVFSIGGALRKEGANVYLGPFPMIKEVLVVQKRLSEEVLGYVARAKAVGALIIYDVDDSGDALWYWAAPQRFYRMLRAADLVTTDTRSRAEWVIRGMARLRVKVVPNCVDYFPDSPADIEPLDRNPLRLLWFGSGKNVGMFYKYATALGQLPDTQVVVCGGNGDVLRGLSDILPVENVPWSRETFVNVLQGCDLTCLMHHGSTHDRRKSNHKMITSICWGVPALVSDTPDYGRTAREIGVEDALFRNPKELVDAVERYRTAGARRKYLDRAQPLVWESYSPAHVAELFLAVLAEEMRRGAASSPRFRTGIRQADELIAQAQYAAWRWRSEDDRGQLLRSVVGRLAKRLRLQRKSR